MIWEPFDSIKIEPMNKKNDAVDLEKPIPTFNGTKTKEEVESPIQSPEDTKIWLQVLRKPIPFWSGVV